MKEKIVFFFFFFIFFFPPAPCTSVLPPCPSVVKNTLVAGGRLPPRGPSLLDRPPEVRLHVTPHQLLQVPALVRAARARGVTSDRSSRRTACRPSAARRRAGRCSGSGRCRPSSPWTSTRWPERSFAASMHRGLLVALGVVLRRVHVALGVDRVVEAPVVDAGARDAELEHLAVREREAGHEAAVAPAGDPDARRIRLRVLS